MRFLANSGWQTVTLDELARPRTISLGGRPARRVFQNCFPKARRLAQPDAPRDHSVIDAFTEMFSHVGNYLLTKVGSGVEHRHHNPPQLQTLVRARIEYLLNEPYNFH